MEWFKLHQPQWQKTDAHRNTATNILYPIHKAGIYLYTTLSGKPIYVGKAEDLEKRFSEHLSDNENNKELLQFLRTQPAVLYYLEVEREEDRQGIELYLFSQLQPQYNNITPSAQRIVAVDLPAEVAKWEQTVH